MVMNLFSSGDRESSFYQQFKGLSQSLSVISAHAWQRLQQNTEVGCHVLWYHYLRKSLATESRKILQSHG